MSYWEVLAEASVALRRDDLAEAERLFLGAREERERSPGRVFLSETVSDAARRLWRRARGQSLDEALAAGRWPAAAAAFRAELQSRGQALTGAALRLAEASDALPDPGRLPVLATALFLLARSQIYPNDLAGAARVLGIAVAVAARAGRPLPPALLRHDLPLAEEARIAVGRRAQTWLPALAAGGAASPEAVRELAAAVLRLIAANWFDPAGRLAAERAWLEAALSDAHLAEPEQAVRLYRAYLAHFAPTAGRGEAVRADQARLRLAELLANVDACHFPVPRYEEAAACLPPACAAELAERDRLIRRALAARRPTAAGVPAWATLAARSEGLTWVLWWGETPRDVVRWRLGDDVEPVRRFLAPCGGRIVRQDVGGRWAEDAPAPDLLGQPAEPFLEALLEPLLPAEGLTAPARAARTAGHVEPWRRGWERGAGHPLLPPPREDGGGALDDPEVGPALSAGLLWLAGLARLLGAHPAAAAGVRVLGRQGDPACALLAGFLAAGLERAPGPERAVPVGLGEAAVLAAPAEPLGLEALGALLPPLAERPGLVMAPATAGSAPGAASAGSAASTGAVGATRTVDLEAGAAGAVLAFTDRPAATLAVWGRGGEPWRVVLDSWQRLRELDAAARAAGRALTLAPPPGGVHARAGALAWLQDGLGAGARGAVSPGAPDVLLLFHWLRLVETHNGDLLDFTAARLRPARAFPLVERYREAIAPLARMDPGASAAGDAWVREYRERAAAATVLAGTVEQLPDNPSALARIWGLAGGGPVAWVFWDSARAHWQLRRRGRAPAALHAELARSGRRHLGLITGGGLWRDELVASMAEDLRPFGRLARADLDAAAPADGRLALASGGVEPSARVSVLAGLAGQLAHLEQLATAVSAAPPLLLLPEKGRPAEFWSAWATRRLPAPLGAAGAFLGADDLWSEGGPPPEVADACLVVPALDSLADAALAVPEQDSPEAWRAADATRAAQLRRLGRDCALEVNALLACGAGRLDLADPRWRRWFPWRGDGPGYDLPGALQPGRAPGVLRKRRAEDERAAALRTWLRDRGWVGPQGHGPVPGASGEAAGPGDGAAGARRHLHVGSLAEIWNAAAQAVAEAREQGDLGAWLLIAGPRAPAGAGALAAAYPAPGVTRWPVEGRAGAGPPGGVLLWVAPEALADADLQAAVSSHPPLLALICDLQDWLPQGADARLGAAQALRFLVDGPLPRVAVHARALGEAWEDFFQEHWAEFGREGAVTRSPSLAETAAGAGVSLPIGRPEPLAARCHDCGAPVELNDIWTVCRTCGLDFHTWASPAAREELTRQSLLAKRDAARRQAAVAAAEAPLEIWVPAAQWASIAAAWSEGDTLARWEDGRLAGRWPEGVGWQLAPDAGWRSPRDGARQALVLPPATLADVLRWPAEAAGAGPSLWYHGPELTDREADRLQSAVARVRALAASFDAVSEPSAVDPAWRGLLPSLLASALSGRDGGQLGEGAALLRWLSSFQPPPGASSGAADDSARPPQEDGQGTDGRGVAGLRLRVLRTRVEIEYRLQRAGAELESALPYLLAGAAPGIVTQCDLAALTARGPAEDLVWLDRLLLACSLSLRDAPRAAAPGANLFEGATGEEELLWLAPAGLLFSSRRLAGYLGRRPALLSRLRGERERLLDEAGALLAAAVPDGDGYVVELPGGPLAAAPVHLAAAGCLLGFWRLESGPADWLDSRRLAGLSAAVWPDSVAAARLAPRLDRERRQWQARLRAAMLDGVLLPAEATPGDAGAPAHAPGAGGARAGERPGAGPAGRAQTEAEPPRVGESRSFVQARQRVAALLARPEPGLLVLRGPAGSGKREASLGALLAAVREDPALADRLTIHCPNAAMGASVALAWRRQGDAPWPGIEVGSACAPSPPGGAAEAMRGAAPASVGVLLAAEAMAREARYAVAQRHREGRLLVTVDPAAAEEPWEHLFLTTPRPEAIADLTDQRRQGRHLWEQTRRLGEAATGARWRGKSVRRERAGCEARWAASLDECVALLTGEQAAGRLGKRVHVVAGLRDDLLFLGRSLAAHGWRPVFRWELDALLLPGALEFLALVNDLTSRPAASWLAPLLPEPERGGYLGWLGGPRPPDAPTLRECYLQVARAAWSRPFLAPPALRQRIERLIADAGEEPPGRLCERPLGEAWRLEVESLSRAASVPAKGPVVTLATPDTVGETGGDLLVYLCTGNEPPRQHYRVVSRASPRLLVLYQERSPLGEDGDEEEA